MFFQVSLIVKHEGQVVVGLCHDGDAFRGTDHAGRSAVLTELNLEQNVTFLAVNRLVVVVSDLHNLTTMGSFSLIQESQASDGQSDKLLHVFWSQNR